MSSLTFKTKELWRGVCGKHLPSVLHQPKKPSANRVKAKVSSKIHKICVEHAKHVEKSCWKTDRVIDAKLDNLQVVLEVEDNKDDNSEYGDSIEEEKDK